MITTDFVEDPEFLSVIRSQIVEEVNDASTVKLAYAGKMEDLHIDFSNRGRDMWPLKAPENMRSTAQDVIRRSKSFLEESSNAREKDAILTIMKRTEKYLHHHPTEDTDGHDLTI